MGQKLKAKIYQIDKHHYELNGLEFSAIINVIKENHKKALHAEFDNLDQVNVSESITVNESYEVVSYCFNQPKEKSYWRLFLPNYIGEAQEFRVTEFSYVLFVKYGSGIFCLVGGSGMTVVKKYLDMHFGIRVYQCFADPSTDVIKSIKTRSIGSNIALSNRTFNQNPTLAQTISYSEVPSRLIIQLGEEAKTWHFGELVDKKGTLQIEAGACFSLRSDMNFDGVLDLIALIDEYLRTMEPVEIALLERVTGQQILEDLDNELKNKIITDIVSTRNGQTLSLRSDIEVSHPTKLAQFYECDKYGIRKKHSRKSSEMEIEGRGNIYFRAIEFISNGIEGEVNEFLLRGELFTTQIIGYKSDRLITKSNFYDHIVAEQDLYNKKYFRIDKNWYYVKKDVLERLKQDAISTYRNNELSFDLLMPWVANSAEEQYNLSNQNENCYVLDRKYKENIELCDLLILRDDVLYLVHVKDGFDAKLRDCYIQNIALSKKAFL